MTFDPVSKRNSHTRHRTVVTNPACKLNAIDASAQRPSLCQVLKLHMIRNRHILREYDPDGGCVCVCVYEVTRPCLLREHKGADVHAPE